MALRSRQDTDWLGACRRATRRCATSSRDQPTTAERVRETGTRGEGGDRTLVIDAAAEDAVFAQLDALHDEGARFTAVSEERGVVDFGGADMLVVIDPIDGSLNAKRGLPHHAISIAVADGPTMADVVFGYVYDFGPEEEWIARRGEGACLDGAGSRREPRRAPRRRRPARAPRHRVRRPALDAEASPTCSPSAHRAPRARHDRGLRSARSPPRGSTAWSRCGAAAPSTPPPAQLIVREAGGLVAFPRFDDPLGAPLDLAPHSPVVAARTAEALEVLARVPVL